MTRSRHPAKNPLSVSGMLAYIAYLLGRRILGKLARSGAENDSCNGCRNALETVVL
jgi:hypothetical protein